MTLLADTSETIVSVLTLVVYLGLASFANLCLMGRDDRNIAVAELKRRNRLEQAGATDSMSRRRRQRPPQGGGQRVGSTNASFISSMGTGFPAAPQNLFMASGNPAPHANRLFLQQQLLEQQQATSPDSPKSISSSRSASSTDQRFVGDDDRMSRSSGDIGDDYGDAVGSSRDTGLASLTVSYSLITTDIRCWFFILVAVSSIACAVTGLVLLLQRSLEGWAHGKQDLVVMTSILLVYITFTSLLLMLHHLVEREVRQVEVLQGEDRSLRPMTVALIVVTPFVLMLPCVFCVVEGVWDEALEVYSTFMEYALCLSYLGSAVYLPRRVLSFGQGLQAVAGKIRNVCVAVAVCMLLRGCVILPPVQKAIQNDGGGVTVALIECTVTIPLLLSMLLLHQPAQ